MPRGMGHLRLRGDIWWLKYSVDGRRHEESSGSTNKTVAVKLLKQRLAKPKGALSNDKLTVQDLIDAVKAQYEHRKAKSYTTFIIPATKHLTAGVGAVKAVKVSRAILTDYIKERQGEGAANGTINRELAILRRAFNLARVDKKIDHDSMPTFELLPEALPRQGFVEPEQYRRLLEVIQDDLKPALVIGYHTGLRREKVLGLRLDQFDLSGWKINMDPEQNAVKKVPTVLPIYGDMVEFVKEHIRKTRETLPHCNLFCHRADGGPLVDFRNGWANATKAAGLPGLLFHDLRRSAIRNCERAGVPRGVAMKMSGHKTEGIYKRYDIISTKDLEDAGEKLERFLGKGGNRVANSDTNGYNPTQNQQDKPSGTAAPSDRGSEIGVE